jgi:hypothetical protein
MILFTISLEAFCILIKISSYGYGFGPEKGLYVVCTAPLSSTWYGFLPSGGGPAASCAWTHLVLSSTSKGCVVFSQETLLNNKFSS